MIESISPLAHHRRMAVAGASVLALAAGGPLPGSRDRFLSVEVTPPEALAASRADNLLFVDTCRPDGWERTGIAVGAEALVMRRDDLVFALTALTGGNHAAPVALICTAEIRSGRLSARLAEAGLPDVFDEPKGMLGSAAGPGWVARDLPVVRS